jgi:PhnB protein
MKTEVTGYLCCDGASEAIQFYGRAFGAAELSRMAGPDGKIGHAEIRIGETALYISDEWAENNIRSPRNLGGNSVSFVLHVPDADAAYARALEAGATIERPLRDEPHGRAGWVHDPWGHHWCIMTDAVVNS